MDVVKALRELYQEKKRLDAAIASLEARLEAGRTGSRKKPSSERRGRKSMSAAERQEVSKRMTLYWQARRAKASGASERDSSDVPPSSPEDQQASTTAVSS